MRIDKLSLFLLLAVIVACAPACAQFGSGPRVVEATAHLSVDRLRPGDSFEFAVRATVREGFHIGAADPAATFPASLTLKAPKGVKFDKPVFPDAVRLESPLSPGEKLPIYEGTFVVKVRGRVDESAALGPAAIEAVLETQGCKDDQCSPPEKTELKVSTEIAARGADITPTDSDVFASTSSASGPADKLAGMNSVVRFLWLYVFGILLAFTPCVYPMVPVTVGYFSSQGGQTRGRAVMLAAIYVLGLALTYSVLGVVAALTGGVFGAAMQTPAVLVGIALVLVALALSMFGLYEIKPPSFIESRSFGRSGALGAFLMGLIFGIVAAPCVGPAVLSLMALVAKIGSPVMGFFMFFALSLGIGTPLFFLAAFSAKLPAPGMWMVAVKKLAGFLLIGAAAYFLQPLLPEKIGAYLLPMVLVATGIYMGFFEKSVRVTRLAHSVTRVAGAGALVFAVFMAVPHPNKARMTWEPYSPEKLAAAEKEGRPAMVDFTAKWCGVCKELEHGPFSDVKVIKASEKVRRLQVDGTDRDDPKVKAAEKKFSVKGYPTVVFLDENGREVESARVSGLIDSSEMLRRVSEASSAP